MSDTVVVINNLRYRLSLPKFIHCSYDIFSFSYHDLCQLFAKCKKQTKIISAKKFAFEGRQVAET